ncbi:MAG: molybdenum cofactor biosynthesis protein [Anaerolineales bacterium]
MTPSMTLSIRLFATLKDLAGGENVNITLNNAEPTIDDVRAALAAQVPALADALPSAIAAVNQEYVFAGHPVTSDDEIAFFPPVSGGDAWPEHFVLNHGPVDLNDLTARIVRPETGAIALFSGYVRGQTARGDSPGETVRLEYEAYEPMALAKMRQVAEEIRAEWPKVQGIAIVQSIGVLEIGQPTVLIACASAHRDDGCFEAARYGIDRLKEIVPIWKKDVRREDAQWIEGHYHPNADDRANPTPDA